MRTETAQERLPKLGNSSVKSPYVNSREVEAEKF